MTPTEAQLQAHEAFIKNQCDVTKTANQLGIGRNSLKKTLFNAHLAGLTLPGAMCYPIQKPQGEGNKHLYIPDCQVTPHTPTDHLSWIGRYIVEKKPDKIINGGDFADMESLSSYDRGKKQFEGRRYNDDCKASRDAMARLMQPLKDFNVSASLSGAAPYKPDQYLTLGNHENRIARAIEDRAEFDGLLSVGHLGYDDWQVIPFLQVKVIDGVHYCHYFYNQGSGKAKGGMSMEYRLKDLGFSFVQGHQQIYMVGSRSLNNGRRLRGLVCGAAYIHDEDYRGPQANSEWRGIFLLHEVVDGDYSLCEVSLDFLCKRYEGLPLWEFTKKKYPNIFEQSLWMQRQEVMA